MERRYSGEDNIGTDEGGVRVRSGLPLTADIDRRGWQVFSGPCMDGARGAREKSDFFAKRSGAAMYPACFRWEVSLGAMQPMWPLALM